MSDETVKTKIAELMARIKAGETSLVDEVVAVFNARPMDRRNGAYRVQGWTVIES